MKELYGIFFEGFWEDVGFGFVKLGCILFYFVAIPVFIVWDSNREHEDRLAHPEKYLPYRVTCIDNVKYIESGRHSLSAKFDENGRVEKCE